MLTDKSQVTFGQGHQMTLTSRISEGLNWNAFSYQRAQGQQKQSLFQLFPFKSLWNQIRSCHKIGQGQPRVIIYINFIELTPQMPHTKFQGNRHSGFGEEDFVRFIPYMGVAAILVM